MAIPLLNTIYLIIVRGYNYLIHIIHWIAGNKSDSLKWFHIHIDTLVYSFLRLQLYEYHVAPFSIAEWYLWFNDFS